MAEQKNKLQITNVNKDIEVQLRNIAKYNGVSVSQLLKPELRKFVDSFPEHIRMFNESSVCVCCGCGCSRVQP